MQSITQQFPAKRDGKIGYDGNEKIKSTKIHIIVTSNGLPISIMISHKNNHDATKFIAMVEHILNSMTHDSPKHYFTDKRYNSRII